MRNEDSSQAAERFLELIRKNKRGKFKLYIGMAAGVGKTCKMLQEARELVNRGVPVLIGVVETHGRAETERLLEGLPILPLREIFYKGKALFEMDCAALLRSKPEVAIVDELAHTNAPGSEREKRWQDVEVLLENGINVISAVNVQHIESLNDVVARVTGVQVTETIPDNVVASADEVVNIDLPAEDLIRRLQEGKIYPPERAQAALQNFFTELNLMQLRELALRQTVNRLEAKIENDPSPLDNKGLHRLAVCVSANEQNARRLIRKTAQIAQGYSPLWYAVYVQTPHESGDSIRLDVQRRLINNLKFAVELGARVEELKGKDVAQALYQFALERDITLFVLGKSERGFFHRLWYGDLAWRLAALTRRDPIDVLIASPDEFTR